MADDKTAAEKLYPSKDEKDTEAMDGMEEGEGKMYRILRKKGFEPNESRWHATNPPGRLFPANSKDPWHEQDS